VLEVLRTSGIRLVIELWYQSEVVRIISSSYWDAYGSFGSCTMRGPVKDKVSLLSKVEQAENVKYLLNHLDTGHRCENGTRTSPDYLTAHPSAISTSSQGKDSLEKYK
jgi:hypothetical protein